MFDFAEATKNMTAVEILNYYRNLYYAEPQITERGIVANAINDILPNMVEVVRCKDCRWFDTTGFEEYNEPEEDLSLHIGWCKSWRKGTQACVFCSYGERKDNA